MTDDEDSAAAQPDEAKRWTDLDDRPVDLQAEYEIETALWP